MSFLTPLRYPGGKGRLGPWLADLLRSNRTSGGIYIEPYSGGAGAAIFLLSKGYVDRIVINDIDPAVHAFWWSVLNQTKKFANRIRRCKVNLSRWEHHRRILANPTAHDLFDVGFAAFFQNRTNRSGILSGGVIGGKNQDGPYKLDARFNREDLASRVEKIGALRDSIDLCNLDALDLIKSLRDKLPKKSLAYFDPPYYVKGSQLYRNYYSPEDHKKIAEAVQDLNTPWIVTYDNCEEVKGLYRKSKSLEFSLHYSTHLSRPKATELMFYGNIDMRVAPYLRR